MKSTEESNIIMDKEVIEKENKEEEKISNQNQQNIQIIEPKSPINSQTTHHQQIITSSYPNSPNPSISNQVNISDNPLFIQELQTTCGCIIPRDELPIVILPHKVGFVNLTFNTIKNTGYVDHFIYCYGNFQDSTCVELEFDTNVVPRADYVHDYEQLWQEQTKDAESIHDFVDGLPGQKGYYTNPEMSPRTRRKEAVQEEIDEKAF